MKAQLATRIIAVALPIAVAMSAVSEPEDVAGLSQNPRTSQAVVQVLNADVNYFWWSTFRHYGWSYSAPSKYVYYDGPGLPTTVQTGGCGKADVNNSFYCSVDKAIYFDINWNQSLISNYGDFGSGFVLIHEWAHHVQTVRPGNWFTWAGNNSFFAARELQADCLAGIYTRYLASTGKLSAGDLNEALSWLSGAGDPVAFPRTHTSSHGTGAERQTWFLAGYNGYNITTCDSVYRYVR